MDNPDISDNALELIITKAINGDETFCDALMTSDWMTELLNQTSKKWARQFKLEPDDLQTTIYDRLGKNIHKVENPNQRTLTTCLAALVNRIAERECLNRARHTRIEVKHAQLVIYQNTRGKRKSATGAAKWMRKGSGQTPEEILLTKEQNRQKADLLKRIQEEIETIAPEYLRILVLWAHGMTLQQIADITRIPLSTVQRHLKKVQKEIIARIGLKQIVGTDPERCAGAFQLIQRSVKKMAHGYFPSCTV